MSLFNKVVEGMPQPSGLGSIPIAGAGSGVKGASASSMGGGGLGSALQGVGKSMIGAKVQGAINQHVPAAVRSAVSTGKDILGAVSSGNMGSAGLMAMGMLGGRVGAAAKQALFMGTPTPLLGGISPSEAKAIYDGARAERYAKKNLFMVDVFGAVGIPEGKFNLFATDVEITPVSLSGEKRRVGGATVDSVTGGEAVELRITTMDDANGTLKKWFAMQAALVEHRDGTMGVPGDYLIGILVRHGIVTEGRAPAHGDHGLFRPVSIEYSLSRREDGMQELQMSFTQLDTFWK